MNDDELSDQLPAYAIQNYLVACFQQHEHPVNDTIIHALVDLITGWLQDSFTAGYDTAEGMYRPRKEIQVMEAEIEGEQQ